MEKILVCGSSIAAGGGMPMGINDPNTWPNLLSRKLNCQLDNVSSPGFDITEIFLNATKCMDCYHYDLVLLEVPTLSRLILSPNSKGFINLNFGYSYEDLTPWHKQFDLLKLSKKEIEIGLKILLIMQSEYHRWKRLVGIISAVQVLNKSGHNVKFINNHLQWTKEFFDNKDSKFARCIINDDVLSDEDIGLGLEDLHQDKQTIDLTLWINPFNSLVDSMIDQAADREHPGAVSNDITSNKIIHYLTA